MLSRRQLLATLASASAAAAGGVAFAQGTTQKLTPEDVAYQTTPMGDQRCSNCSQFTAPNICAILTSRVVPSGWCSAWAKKPA